VTERTAQAPAERDLAAAKEKSAASTAKSHANRILFREDPAVITTREALVMCMERAQAPLDSLHATYLEFHANDPAKTEAYGMAMDELDKVVFGIRTMIDILDRKL